MSSSSGPLAAPALVPAPRNDLCLDFANSRFWRGTAEPTETLGQPEDLAQWCASNAAQPPETLNRWRALLSQEPARGEALLREAIVLRETLHRLFAGAAEGRAPGAAELEPLNRVLAQAPARDRLQRTEDGYAWHVAELKLSVPHLLAPVLWSAADLLVEPQLARVRQCGNPKCVWLFLDTSRAGNRRWCTMSMCGNRAKAKRHYLRHRG
jgi:predicted RNA-binding Zn ribbon-like protein